MADSANGRPLRTGVRRRRGSSPRSADRPTVPQVKPLVDQLYASDEGGVGAALHIVLDDGNLQDSHIQWCLDQLPDDRYSTETNDLCRRIGEAMLQMTGTQRRKLR